MLNNMYEYGYITKEELEENYDADLVLNYDKGGALGICLWPFRMRSDQISSEMT